jgi:hypothetical protein
MVLQNCWLTLLLVTNVLNYIILLERFLSNNFFLSLKKSFIFFKPCLSCNEVFKPFFWLSLMWLLYYNISGLLGRICSLVHLVFLKRVSHHKLRNKRREQSRFYYLFNLSCILFEFVKFCITKFQEEFLHVLNYVIKVIKTG